MSVMDNTRNRLFSVTGLRMGANTGGTQKKCKFCGVEAELTRIAVMGDDEKLLEDIPDKRFMFVCESDYERLLEASEYTIREIPNPVDVQYDNRKEVGNEVKYLSDSEEKGWVKASQWIEIDLSQEQ